MGFSRQNENCCREVLNFAELSVLAQALMMKEARLLFWWLRDCLGVGRVLMLWAWIPSTWTLQESRPHLQPRDESETPEVHQVFLMRRSPL